MVDFKYISIKEFAEEVGLSKQAIYQRLEKDLKPFVEIENGIKPISTKALLLFVDNPVNQVDHFKSTEKQKSDVSEVLINSLLNQLEIKDKQIAEKDRQLNEKDKQLAANGIQISQLSTALMNEQHSAQQAHALHAGTIQQSIERKVSKGIFSKWFGRVKEQ